MKNNTYTDKQKQDLNKIIYIINQSMNIIYNKSNNKRKNQKGGNWATSSYNPASTNYCPYPVSHGLFGGLINAIGDSGRMAGQLFDVVGGMISEMETLSNVQSDLGQPFSASEVNAPGYNLNRIV